MHVSLAVFVDILGLTSLTLIDPPTLWVDVKNTLTFEISVSCTANKCDAYTVDQVGLIHDTVVKWFFYSWLGNTWHYVLLLTIGIILQLTM